MVGRSRTTIVAGTETYSDALFAAHRYEGDVFTEHQFEHSTFANNSFKDTEFVRCTFRNVAFVGVYFRDTILRECRFEGCKFIDCDMSRVDIRSCDLKFYNSFLRTHVPFARLSECLPKEGNLRQQLCENLAREAAGDAPLQWMKPDSGTQLASR